MLSGFSHHAGRLEASDVRGIMALLDATLIQTGKLNIVEQTNTAARGQGQSRVETLQLLGNLGAKVSYTTLAGAGSAPSAVTATRDTVTTTGPNAVENPTVTSNLTTGLARVEKLVGMRETIERWRPWLGPPLKQPERRQRAKAHQRGPTEHDGGRHERADAQDESDHDRGDERHAHAAPAQHGRRGMRSDGRLDDRHVATIVQPARRAPQKAPQCRGTRAVRRPDPCLIRAAASFVARRCAAYFSRR